VTVGAADVSAVAPELRGAVAALRALYAGCEAVAGGNPAKRRELDDGARKLGALLWRLNAGQVSPGVAEKLRALGAALDAGDFVTAGHVQVALTTADWDECAGWLTALKRLVKTRQAGA
jgi:protein transport protein SEC31